MGANVFLSYARADSPLAEHVADSLARSGVEAAVVPGPVPGQDFADAIRSKLLRSDAVVLFLSESAVNSSWVMAELGAAMALDKRVFAVRHDPAPLSISVSSLSHLQVLEAEGMSADQIAGAIRDRLAA